MSYAIILDNGQPQEISPGQAFVSSGIQYPSNWLSLSNEEDRQQAGVYTIFSDPIPPGKISYTSILGWDGERVSRIHNLVDEPPPPPPPSPPPLYIPQISARQLRLWLLSNGITSTQVEGIIEAIEDPVEYSAAMIEWEYTTIFDRNHPMITTIGTQLGLTSQQIDEGFIQASSI